MRAFIIPVLLTVAVGLAASLILSAASKLMASGEPSEAENIRKLLPGANCGACGFAGCDGYAAALAEDGGADPALCAMGGKETAAEIAKLLGKDYRPAAPSVAVVRCSGTKDAAAVEMDYQGKRTCASAKGLFGGPGSCKYGCIGFGDCESVCPQKAISVCNGIARVDRDLCIGCGLCAKACPQKIIDIVPKTKKYAVSCSSKDPGRMTKAYCQAGCIGCMICERECTFEAIKVTDGRAVIDYGRCVGCGQCAVKCPRKVITMLDA